MLELTAALGTGAVDLGLLAVNTEHSLCLSRAGSSPKYTAIPWNMRGNKNPLTVAPGPTWLRVWG